MLAQILHDLYIPQEILDELPEDQKQLLFCKMREEQVRRYHEREMLNIVKTAVNTSKKKKQVTFRLDAAGNESCWIMGESLDNIEEPFHNRNNNENMEIDYQKQDKKLRTNTNDVQTFPVNDGVFYKVHRDERKQIEEISNNIQEARRIFERLESETRKLVLTKENEVSHTLKRSQSTPIPISQSDFVDEIFYQEAEKRAKKADQERREAARRVRDLFHSQSSKLNVCFDTDNSTQFTLQPMILNSSNRTKSIETKLDFGLEEKKTPAFPVYSTDTVKQLEISQEPQSIVNSFVYPQSKPASGVTHADIRHWFRTTELLHSTFRSADGQIYPWFHGIISRAYTEQLLSSKPIGSYLIRVSEKMFGYVLSYLASDHCRHLLIEVTQPEHAYRFLGGAKSELFGTLSQLIEKYTNIPIRSNSTDVLCYSCGQIDLQQADYADLFVENTENDNLYESLYISLDTTTSSLQSTTHL